MTLKLFFKISPWILFMGLFTALSFSSASAEEGVKSETEAGVVLTSGNTETTTVSTKDLTTYEFSKNRVRLFGSYLYQKTGEVLSAKTWSLGIRYERLVSDRMSFFLGQAVEGDRFKGIVQAYHTDLGAKYFFAKEEGFTWFGEAGYRLTRENAVTYEKTKHYARAYTEIEKRWNVSVFTKYWLEVLPNFSESTDWQANTELSLTAVLTGFFSVKSALLAKYDHLPNEPSLGRTDRFLTTSLVAKF